MTARALALEAAPPFDIPLRFFLTAPVFACAAGLLLAWIGPDALVSRWMPAALAATHLLTTGTLAMVMIGALFQMLPVVAGAPLPRPAALARFVHPSLTVGTACLAGGFVVASPWLFRVAAVALGAGFGIFTIAALAALVRVRGTSPTVTAIRFAVLALAIVVATGVAFAAAFGWALTLPTPSAVGQHALWGLVGWIGLLIVGVSYQVVPMFQLTPAFDARVARALPYVLLGALVAASAAHVTGFFHDTRVEIAVAATVALASLVYVGAVGRLQGQRRRRLPSPLVAFWRTGLASLLAAVAIWFGSTVSTTIGGDPRWGVATGVLALVGFVLSVISGMLYKIVPFLAWLHLQELRPPRGSVPNMKEVLPDAVAFRQWRAHATALALLVAAALFPGVSGLARVAGLALALSAAWLLVNLLRVRARYLASRRDVVERNAATVNRPSPP